MDEAKRVPDARIYTGGHRGPPLLVHRQRVREREKHGALLKKLEELNLLAEGSATVRRKGSQHGIGGDLKRWRWQRALRIFGISAEEIREGLWSGEWPHFVFAGFEIRLARDKFDRRVAAADFVDHAQFLGR